MAEKIVDWTHLLLQASTQSRVPPRTLWKIGLGYEATPAFCLEDTANSKKLKEQLETKGGKEKTLKTKQLMLFELVSTTLVALGYPSQGLIQERPTNMLEQSSLPLELELGPRVLVHCAASATEQASPLLNAYSALPTSLSLWHDTVLHPPDSTLIVTM